MHRRSLIRSGSVAPIMPASPSTNHLLSANELATDMKQENSLPNILDQGDNFSSAGSDADTLGLRDFQSTLDMICNSSMDPVIIIDENGKIKSVNAEAMEMFGYQMWELVGHDIKLIMTEKYAKKHSYYLERYKKTKMKRIIGQRRNNLEGVRKDKVVLRLDSKIQAINGIYGGSVYIGLLRDMGIANELGTVKSMIGNMLPKGYEERVMSGNTIANQFYACVLYCTIENVIAYAKTTTPTQLVETFSKLFTEFEEACARRKATRIKSMGDVFMAASGVTKVIYDASMRVMEAAWEITEIMNKFPELAIKIGVATGYVISGVCRSNQLSFDLWGEPVHTSARLKGIAPKGAVMCCEKTYKQTKLHFEYKAVKTNKEEKLYIATTRKQTII